MKIHSCCITSCEITHLELTWIGMSPSPLFQQKYSPPPAICRGYTHRDHKLATPISFLKVDPSFEGKQCQVEITRETSKYCLNACKNTAVSLSVREIVAASACDQDKCCRVNAEDCFYFKLSLLVVCT